MKELIIGTGNAAKKKAIGSVLIPLGLTIRGTDDLGITLEIPEDGATARENARKKSLLYAQAAGQPVLSVDNALYLEGLPAEKQPGIHTRSIPGKTGRATDQELLAFYAQTIERLGGRMNGHWEWALCLADAHGRICEHSFFSPRIFVGTPSPRLLPGYPLESIQLDPQSGTYVAEMSEEEQAAFWQKTIGQALVDFVQKAAPVFN